MASIAKFVSYDGGIAFSDNAMKVQKRGGEATIIPLKEVISIRVRKAHDGMKGYMWVQLVNNGRFKLSFEDDQYEEAVQFKGLFDETFGLSGTPAPSGSGGRRPATPPARSKSAPYSPQKKDTGVGAGLIALVAVLFVVAVAGAVLLMKEAGII